MAFVLFIPLVVFIFWFPSVRGAGGEFSVGEHILIGVAALVVALIGVLFLQAKTKLVRAGDT